MAAQLSSLEPTATQVLAVTVEQTSVLGQSVAPAATHSTQAPATTVPQYSDPVAALHLFRVAEMAAQVVSSAPAATQVLGVTVEMVGVPALVAAVHDTHAEFVASHLGVAAEMAAQVVSSAPAATQVFAVTVDTVGVSALGAAVHD
jgi:hypothetical protein